MGLDMYLDGVNYYPTKTDDNGNIIRKRQIIKTLECDWRKDNQIHKWFVDNVQWGEDDCNSYELTSKELDELLQTCIEVIESNNSEKAKELLPVYEGPFFGQYDYNEDYYDGIKYTIKKLKRILKNADEYDWFEYRSSW